MARNRQNNSNNKNASRSQRRLALAVLLIILAVSTLLGTSDDPAIQEYRNQLFNRLGFTSGQNIDDPDNGGTTEPAVGRRTDGDIADIAFLDTEALPEYDGHNYVTINGSKPVFPQEVYDKAGLVEKGGKWKTEGTLAGVDSGKLVKYEYYGELDSLGRCTEAYGCLGLETMPESGTERGDIASIHPSGWAKAQNWERSHLIAWALSDENANAKNLITGTHYLNYDGMRPLEEEVEHYIWDTGNHVLYMARPVFSGNEKIARGINMMAYSVEDNGKGISFNVYCFNVTPGAAIDYNTGIVTTAEQAAQDARVYIINTRSGVFHYPTCEGAQQISKWNRKEVTATRVELTEQGYTPCGYCEP